MPKRLSKSKRPKDLNLLAHQLVRESTEREPEELKEEKPSRTEISRVMAAMGRKGGKKSAKSRMEKISPHERSRIALKAAQARWAKKQAKGSNS
jgi:hypothetical protein